MKNNVTEIVFILDKSGSMGRFAEDTVGGFNSTLESQKGKEGSALVSTVLFDDKSVVIHDRVDIEDINPMTRNDYRPGGCTALLDAIGDAIHHIGTIHKYARYEDVPEHTVFIITTDGMENASHRYSADKVREMIKRQTEKYGWEFIFLAANIDAVGVAENIGIRKERAVNYYQDSEGTHYCYEAMDIAVNCVRKNEDLDSSVWRQRIDTDYKKRRKK